MPDRAAIRDPAPLARLVRDRVVLDVCPSSHVGVGLYPSLEARPVADFWRADVNMTISSDDPPFFHTTLTNEPRQVVRLAGLARDDLAELQRPAARHSFASPEVKGCVLGEIEAWAAGGRSG